MNAIFDGRRHTILDDCASGVLLRPLDGGPCVEVDFGDPSLVVEPTDDQWDAEGEGRPIPTDPGLSEELADIIMSFAPATVLREHLPRWQADVAGNPDAGVQALLAELERRLQPGPDRATAEETWAGGDWTFHEVDPAELERRLAEGQ